MWVYIYISMLRRIFIILFLSLGLMLMEGQVLSAETTKTAPASPEQGAQKTFLRSIFSWLSSPRNWLHSRKTSTKATDPGLIAGTRNNQAAVPDAPLHLLPPERQGRDARDSFKTFLFIRPKPGITDLGAPENVQGKANSSPRDGCAAYGGDGNSSDDKKLPSLTDLSLGICMRF